MDHKTVSTETLILELVLLVCLIGINGFFVAVEFAVVASRRSRLESLRAKPDRAMRIASQWVSDAASKDRLIAASQLGITVASMALGIVGESAFQSIFGTFFEGFNGFSVPVQNIIRAMPLLLSLVIVSGLHVIFGEQIPKVAALRGPERLLMAMVMPMEWFRRVTGPFNRMLDTVANLVLRTFGLAHAGGHSMLYSVEELRQIVAESEEGGVLRNTERELLDAVFDLRAMYTRQVMVPRTEVVMLEAAAPVSAALELLDTLPYTKFPIYEHNTDHIIGVVHLKDVLHAVTNHENQRPVRELARDVIAVPEMLPVDALLTRFRSQNQHIAVVLDEYGGTAGIVTLQDVLEELVGDIQDQFTADERPEIQHLPDGSGVVSGLALIADVNEAFALDITDDNYDTIGGYIMGKLERIPQPGDTVEVNGLKLRVDRMDDMRIDLLSIRTRASSEAPPQPE